MRFIQATDCPDAAEPVGQARTLRPTPGGAGLARAMGCRRKTCAFSAGDGVGRTANGTARSSQSGVS